MTRLFGVEKPGAGKAWDLRGFWARRRRVAVRLSERCSVQRLEGYVQQVAATDAFVVIAVAGEEPILIPMDDVLSVHHPSRLGDSTIDTKEKKTMTRQQDTLMAITVAQPAGGGFRHLVMEGRTLCGRTITAAWKRRAASAWTRKPAYRCQVCESTGRRPSA